jgi:hypothetical protein
MTSSLHQLISQSPFNIFFPIVDRSLDLSLNLPNFYPIYAFRQSITNPNSFCFEDQTSPSPSNSAKLLSHPLVQEYIENITRQTGRQAAVLVFKPSAKTDLVCQKLGYLLISNPAKLNRQLENKIYFSRLCAQNHIPTPASQITKLNPQNFISLQKKFGQDLIIQTAFGWAGNSTYLANSWSQLKDIIPADSLVKISPKLEGYTLINNACLTHQGLIQSPPALQYTGIPQLTSNPFSTVGRQWPSHAPADILDQVASITEKFAQVLKTSNYLGYFGLDFFVHDHQVLLLECNPRLTASFSFYHQLEQQSSFTPLLYLHLAEFLHIPYLLDPNREQRRFFDHSLQGSQLVKRNSQGLITNMLTFPTPLSRQPFPLSIDNKFIDSLLHEGNLG